MHTFDPAKQFSYRSDILRNQRTPEGLAYEQFMRGFRAMRGSRDAKVRAALEEANRSLVLFRDNGSDAVHVDATMAEMSIRYVNDEYIGDRLMPMTTVSRVSNIYAVYDARASLGFPDDSLGERGQANEVNQGVDLTHSYSCIARGLESYVDLREMDNADAPLDPLTDASIIVNEGVMFNRELRYSAKLTTSANFGSNTAAITAGSEWNSAGNGNPVKDIQKAVDAVRGGRNPTRLVGYCSVNVFRVLSRHPAIRDLFKYEKEGFATAQQLAQYFEMDEILVGKARKDNANVGQTEADVRIWSDVFGIVRVAPVPTTRSYQFGTTFRNGPIETVQLFDRKLGKKGGYIVKIALDEDYKIVASNAGYLLTGVLDAALL